MADTLLANKPSAVELKTVHRVNPLGIDADPPTVSWQMRSGRPGAAQAGYQIRVATSLEDLRAGRPEMDTGEVASSDSLSVPLEGLNLRSGQRYHWQVRVQDDAGEWGEFSEPAFFEMALLKPEDWEGHWITSPIPGNGYHSALDSSVDVNKWVQVDLGEQRTFSAVRLFPARPFNWNEDTPGFGYPVRFRLEASDEEGFGSPKVLADFSEEDVPSPGEEPQTYEFAPVEARFVRVNVNRLYTRIDGQKLFALAEMQVLDGAGENLAANMPVTALDESTSHAWRPEFLTQGVAEVTDEARIAPMFRREFELPGKVSRARAYICGLGYNEFCLNGQRVGDHVLDPAYTSFDRRSYYSTYDVTELLREGKNAAGVLLGKGWFGRSSSLMLQLNVQMEDGSTFALVTDEQWKRGRSPILDSSLYHGEHYDARLEQPGWTETGFNDSEWDEAVAVEPVTQKLSAQTIQPIRVVREMPVQSMRRVNDAFVFDFGQNFSGWTHLSVEGAEGDTVYLKHAELLYPDGSVNTENLRAAKGTDTYVLKGSGGVEEWEPRFTYHGFRYVQLEGYEGTPPGKDMLSGRLVHTDFPEHGEFQCSHTLINQIHQNAVWGFRTNFHSIPTDCPQRDERQGWMGDAHMTADMGFYNFDMGAAYAKFLQDIADAQGPDGRIPDTVPHIWGTDPGDPMWSAAYHLIVRDYFRHTGDRTILEKHFDGLKRYVDMLEREADGYIITRNNYGDWIGVEKTPNDLISTGSFILVSRIVAEVAEVLGRDEDVRRYRDLEAKITGAFNGRFLDAETGVYGNGSQYSYVWPLYLGIVPREQHSGVVDRLVEDIMVTRRGHLSTGFLGARYLFEVLCNEGHADVAYEVVTKKDYPSYGYMIDNGATTIWELWELQTGPGMNSHNHPALGFVSGWFYRNIAGIVPRWDAPGFAHFDVKPFMMGGLTEASAFTDTVRGRVSSAWTRDEGSLTLNVEVPANSRASVWVPRLGLDSVEVAEGGDVVWRGEFVPGRPGISEAADEGQWIRFEVGAGEYEFQVRASA